MYGLLFEIAFFVFGGFIHFRAQLRWIKKYYRFHDTSSPSKVVAYQQADPEATNSIQQKKYEKASNHARINLCNSLCFYLKHETIIGYALQLCKSSDEMSKYEKIIIKGREMLNRDFNFKYVIDSLHGQ